MRVHLSKIYIIRRECIFQKNIIRREWARASTLGRTLPKEIVLTWVPTPFLKWTRQSSWDYLKEKPHFDQQVFSALAQTSTRYRDSCTLRMQKNILLILRIMLAMAIRVYVPKPLHDFETGHSTLACRSTSLWPFNQQLTLSSFKEGKAH